jgi:hypothetical protein
MISHKKFFVAFILSAVFHNLWAQSLKFDSILLQLNPSLEQRVIKGSFQFNNASNDTVEIISTKSSCGCTVPLLKKKIFAPKEYGEIDVQFEIGQRKGIQNKTLTITTNEDSKSIYLLRLKVVIPELLSIQPKLLFWRFGQTYEEKKIQILLNKETSKNFKILSIKSENTGFTIKKTHQTHKIIELSILPNPNLAKTKSKITLQTNFPLTKPKIFQV